MPEVPDTRLRIILTAMQLFWEKGYASTSVADILKAAGVNSGTLEDVGHAGRGIALFPEQLHRAQDDALAGVGRFAQGLFERSIK